MERGDILVSQEKGGESLLRTQRAIIHTEMVKFIATYHS